MSPFPTRPSSLQYCCHLAIRLCLLFVAVAIAISVSHGVALSQSEPDVLTAGFFETEDFEALSNGPIDGRSSWTATSNVDVATDPANSSNNVIRFDQGSEWAYKAWPATIPDDSSGTLFFRVRRVGLLGTYGGASDDLTPDLGYDELETMFGLRRKDPDPFTVKDSVNSYPLNANFDTNTWYCVWTAINNPSNNYEVYIQGGELTNVTLLNSSGQTTFDFRNGGSNALKSFAAGSAEIDDGGTFYYDDIFVDPDSINLSNPSANSCGGAAPTCYDLTRDHTGSGADPVASPSMSSGCNTGEYVAGESILLSASPASGWQVTNWSGTNNNSSTSMSNSVTMPAGNHTVTVNYGQECYPLSRTHSGSGSDPVATPSRSSACATGEYVAGESISLSASPSSGWAVAGWSGTSNDGSTSRTNSFVMPDSSHVINVNYYQPCYRLTRTHSGSGSDPVATPSKSSGCGTGEYVAGESISLAASPDGTWRVTSWSGTSNDSSTSTTNFLSMPASTHVVSVNYDLFECYQLTRTHDGSGSDPVASPSKSNGCGTGEYFSGELISLSASPASGWNVLRWSGTDNDSSSSNTNSLTMPAGNHTASVVYSQPTCYRLTSTHSGNGNDPVASPSGSNGCGASEYFSGELISLSASPVSGWNVLRWSGTDDDSSSSNTNSLTMPAGNHTVSVNYVERPTAPGTVFMPLISWPGVKQIAFPALMNGNFDGADVSVWQQETSSSDGLHDLIVNENSIAEVSAYSPPKLAWLGGTPNVTDDLSQEVFLPAEYTNVALNYRYQIHTSEGTNGCGDDVFRLRIFSVDTGQFHILSSENMCASTQKHDWASKTVSLGRFAGQRIRIHFVAVINDDEEQSSFFIDNVKLCDGSGAQPCN